MESGDHAMEAINENNGCILAQVQICMCHVSSRHVPIAALVWSRCRCLQGCTASSRDGRWGAVQI